jgi:hypothetical protein
MALLISKFKFLFKKRKTKKELLGLAEWLKW